MNPTVLVTLLTLAACSSPNPSKKPLGATKQQAATQEAAKGISNPAVPPTVQPPAGTPIIIPPVTP